MSLLFLIVVSILTVGAALITIAACVEMEKARRLLRATQLALAIAEQAAADEEARKESALRLLDEVRSQFLDQQAEYLARLDVLEVQCLDALQVPRRGPSEKLVRFKPKVH